MTDAVTKDLADALPVSFSVRAIGYIQSPYRDPDDVTHRHDGWTSDVSRIRLLSQHAGGLGGLDAYSHVMVLFWIHRAGEWTMPRHHHKPPHVKVFATRMPVRPNPIGLSVVELLECSPQTGDLVVRGLDALDGTPVLDIKPYIPNFDSRPAARLPQWVAEHLESHFHGRHGHSHGPDGCEGAGTSGEGSR